MLFTLSTVSCHFCRRRTNPSHTCSHEKSFHPEIVSEGRPKPNESPPQQPGITNEEPVQSPGPRSDEMEELAHDLGQLATVGDSTAPTNGINNYSEHHQEYLQNKFLARNPDVEDEKSHLMARTPLRPAQNFQRPMRKRQLAQERTPQQMEEAIPANPGSEPAENSRPKKPAQQIEFAVNYCGCSQPIAIEVSFQPGASEQGGEQEGRKQQKIDEESTQEQITEREHQEVQGERQGRLEEGRLGEGRLGEGRLGEGRLGEGRLGEGRLGESDASAELTEPTPMDIEGMEPTEIEEQNPKDEEEEETVSDEETPWQCSPELFSNPHDLLERRSLQAREALRASEELYCLLYEREAPALSGGPYSSVDELLTAFNGDSYLYFGADMEQWQYLHFLSKVHCSQPIHCEPPRERCRPHYLYQHDSACFSYLYAIEGMYFACMKRVTPLTEPEMVELTVYHRLHGLIHFTTPINPLSLWSRRLADLVYITHNCIEVWDAFLAKVPCHVVLYNVRETGKVDILGRLRMMRREGEMEIEGRTVRVALEGL